MLLLGLAICWIAILVPPMVRGRSPRQRTTSSADFTTALNKLGDAQTRIGSVTPLRSGLGSQGSGRPGHSLDTPPAALATLFAMPENTDDARRRRRDIIVGLGGLAAFTLLVALVIGSAAVAAHLLVDVALIGFVMAVAQRQRITEERREKVTPLRPAQAQTPARTNDELLRRSGT